MKTRFMDVRSSSPLLQPDYAMRITRRFTREGQDPFAGIEFAAPAVWQANSTALLRHSMNSTEMNAFALACAALGPHFFWVLVVYAIGRVLTAIIWAVQEAIRAYCQYRLEKARQETARKLIPRVTRVVGPFRLVIADIITLERDAEPVTKDAPPKRRTPKPR